MAKSFRIIIGYLNNIEKSMKSITIAVPVYGVEKYIERCARSLFEQTYKDIEYLFVDDCSPDKSFDVLRSVMEDYPERKTHIKIVRHDKNRGLGAARNTALENCQTEFIMHVDSDDSIEKDTVEIIMGKQAEGEYDIVRYGFNNIYSYNKTKKVVWPEIESAEELAQKTLARKVPVCVCGGLYRTSLYKDYDIRVADGVNNSEDYCVTPRLAYYAKSVAVIRACLYNYYIGNEGAYTNSFSEEKSKQALRVLKINEDFFKEIKEYKDSLDFGRSGVIIGQIRGTLRNGRNVNYYKKMQRYKNLISYEYIRSMRFFDRLTTWDINNYYVASYLYRMFRILYRMKNKIVG